MRHHRAGAPWVAARYFGGHVVNAGDGWHAHPTQALLDLFTLRRAWGGGADALRGRKIAIVGDILHSRVARSNIWSLTQAGRGCVAVRTARLDAAASKRWPKRCRLTAPVGHRCARVGRRRGGCRDGPARPEGTHQGRRCQSAEYLERYQINAASFARAKPGALYLHPGPINEGVEVTREVCLGPRSLVMEQVAQRRAHPHGRADAGRAVGRGTRGRRAPADDQASALTRDLSSVIR